MNWNYITATRFCKYRRTFFCIYLAISVCYLLIWRRRKDFAKIESENFIAINGVGCPLPDLKLHDPSLAQFFFDPEPLDCRGEKYWVQVRNQTLYFSRNHPNLDCTYVEFTRKNDIETAVKAKYKVTNGSRTSSDFFRLDCTEPDGKTLSNIYATIFPLKNKKSLRVSTGHTSENPKLNVYILGEDSLSRLSFMRKLPKTYEYLTKKLQSVVLSGYNIVGDGTPQALIPILTGKTELELPPTRKRDKEAQFVDVYPFIWNEFKDAGYVTMHGEDMAQYGTFTYRLKGFHKQPTDHYLRTFVLVSEKVAQNEFCLQGEEQHKLFLKYAEDFFHNYPTSQLKFSFLFLGVLSHNDMNQVQVADDDFKDHLVRLDTGGHLNNTLLVVMADHGTRFAKVRNTHQGQLEERLPFMSFYAPQWFRKKHKRAWKNLQANSEVLTTPFDIHATLKALLNWREPRKGELSGRAISLFDQVPKARTCADAAVEPHWCACMNWERVKTENSVVQQIAQAIVRRINAETKPVRRLCAELRLDNVVDAKRQVPNESLLKYKAVKDVDGFVPDLSGWTSLRFATYQIHLVTEPGAALYEATVEYEYGKEILVDLNVVSHISVYGDKPHCIIDDDYFKAKWCVCYDKITQPAHGKL